MGQFEFSKVLMEKILRRAFLDGVIELYENCPCGRIYSVALEGDLSLTINKCESYDIRLFEIAQRAPGKPIKTEPLPTEVTLKSEDVKPKIKSESNRGTLCSEEVSSPVREFSTVGVQDGSKDSSVSTAVSASDIDMPKKKSLVHSVTNDEPVNKNESPVIDKVNVEATQTVDSSVKKDVSGITDKPASCSKQMSSGSQVSVDVNDGTSEPLNCRETVCTSSGDDGCCSKETPSCDSRCDAVYIYDCVREGGSEEDMCDDRNPTEQHSSTPHRPVSAGDGVECESADASPRGSEPIFIDDEKETITKGRPEMLSPRHKRRRMDRKQCVEKTIGCPAGGGQELGCLTSRGQEHSSLTGGGQGHGSLASRVHGGGCAPDRLPSACPLCSAVFRERDYFVLHVEAHRQQLGLSCLICAQGNLQTDGYLYHLATHHGQSIIQAAAELSGLARDGLGSAASRQPQLPPVVKSEGEFRCLQCGRDFLTIGMLESHAESHRQEDLEAEQQRLRGDVLEAEGQTLRMDSLEAKHWTLKVDRLELDQKTTTKVENLKSGHDKLQKMELKREIFPGIKTDFKDVSYSCELCSEVFSHPSSLAEHHRQEHSLQVRGQMSLYVNDHPDDSCSDDVTTPLSPHRCLDMFACQRCGRSFRSWRSLKYHYLTSHGLQYTCEVCRGAFPTPRHLQQHEDSHVWTAAEPVFKCSICDKTFPSATHCTAHKRSHTSAKPHTCDLCGSCFFKRGDLTKHVRTVHCPKKHFVCKVCGRTGTRSDNMRVHVKLHQKFMSRDQVDQLIEEVYNKQ